MNKDKFYHSNRGQASLENFGRPLDFGLLSCHNPIQDLKALVLLNSFTKQVSNIVVTVTL